MGFGFSSFVNGAQNFGSGVVHGAVNGARDVGSGVKAAAEITVSTAQANVNNTGAIITGTYHAGVAVSQGNFTQAAQTVSNTTATVGHNTVNYYQQVANSVTTVTGHEHVDISTGANKAIDVGNHAANTSITVAANYGGQVAAGARQTKNAIDNKDWQGAAHHATNTVTTAAHGAVNTAQTATSIAYTDYGHTAPDFASGANQAIDTGNHVANNAIDTSATYVPQVQQGITQTKNAINNGQWQTAAYTATNTATTAGHGIVNTAQTSANIAYGDYGKTAPQFQQQADKAIDTANHVANNTITTTSTYAPTVVNGYKAAGQAARNGDFNQAATVATTTTATAAYGLVNTAQTGANIAYGDYDKTAPQFQQQANNVIYQTNQQVDKVRQQTFGNQATISSTITETHDNGPGQQNDKVRTGGQVSTNNTAPHNDKVASAGNGKPDFSALKGAVGDIGSKLQRDGVNGGEHHKLDAPVAAHASPQAAPTASQGRA